MKRPWGVLIARIGVCGGGGPAGAAHISAACLSPHNIHCAPHSGHGVHTSDPLGDEVSAEDYDRLLAEKGIFSAHLQLH